MSVGKIGVAVLLGLFVAHAAEQKPCGNSGSYIDQLCKRKQSGLSAASGLSSSKGKMPSTPLVPDFEIEPFADEGKGGKKGTSPFKW